MHTLPANGSQRNARAIARQTPRTLETRDRITADGPRWGAVGEAAIARTTPRTLETRDRITADGPRWGAVGGAAIAPPTL
jgi:hypothetical protein